MASLQLWRLFIIYLLIGTFLHTCRAKAGDKFCDGSLCYVFRLDKMSWAKAKKDCERNFEGHLVNDIDEKTHIIIENELNKRCIYKECREVIGVWLGGSYDGDKWKWTTTDLIPDKNTQSFGHWKTGEPNYFSPTGTKDFCMATFDIDGSWQWSDFDCKNEKYFMCSHVYDKEKDSSFTMPANTSLVVVPYTEPTAAPDVWTPEPPRESEEDVLSTGAIIGIVLGAIVGVLVLICLFKCITVCIRKRNKKRKAPKFPALESGARDVQLDPDTLEAMYSKPLKRPKPDGATCNNNDFGKDTDSLHEPLYAEATAVKEQGDEPEKVPYHYASETSPVLPMGREKSPTDGSKKEYDYVRNVDIPNPKFSLNSSLEGIPYADTGSEGEPAEEDTSRTQLVENTLYSGK